MIPYSRVLAAMLALLVGSGVLVGTLRCALMAVMLLAPCRAASATTAAELLDYCQTRRHTEVGYGFCVGSFITISGLVSITEHYDEDNRSIISGICLRWPTSAQQIQAIFTKYVSDHPQYLTLEYQEVAFTALREVFPCKGR